MCKPKLCLYGFWGVQKYKKKASFMVSYDFFRLLLQIKHQIR